MNDYFNHSTNVISNGTRATAAQVNNIAYEIGVGLDKLPTEAHIKRGTINYAADTGSANLYAVSLPYPPASYTDGMEVVFKAANSNTGACSMNVNSLGVKSIKRADGTDPAASEIPANKITTLRYNSTSSVFEIQNGAGYASSAAASATASAASAAAALVSEGNASGSATAAANSAAAALVSQNAAAASAAMFPSTSGKTLNYIRVNAAETAWETRTPTQTAGDLITGGASSIATTDLTASRALISGTGGKVAVSSVTSAELAKLSGLTADAAEINALDETTVTTGTITIAAGAFDSVTLDYGIANIYMYVYTVNAGAGGGTVYLGAYDAASVSSALITCTKSLGAEVTNALRIRNNTASSKTYSYSVRRFRGA